MTTEMAKGVANGAALSLRAYLDGAVAVSADDWCGESILDVKRTYNNSGELCAVELLIGFGGPNVWATFNGQGCEIKASWYCEPVYEWVDCEEFSTEMLELFDNWVVRQ